VWEGFGCLVVGKKRREEEEGWWLCHESWGLLGCGSKEGKEGKERLWMDW